MKKLIFLMLMVAQVVAFAQKQPKPNINKALSSMKEGKLAEAKEMIDAATTYEKTMNDGKTWYYRGLIYTAIDTTSNESFKSLDPNALNVALESFAKADQLGKPGVEYFVQGATVAEMTTKSQQLEMLANYYLDKGIKAFQDDQDNEASLKYLGKNQTVFEKAFGDKNRYANDTLSYYVTSLVAQQSDKYDEAIAAANKYLDKGGKNKDVYLILYQIYNNGPKEDKNKALDIIRQARKALPNNPDFPKVEIGMLIDMNRVDEAKTNLESALKTEPNNKILHFYMGYINSKVSEINAKKVDSLTMASKGKPDPATTEKINSAKAIQTQTWEAAKKNFDDALKIDPKYFDAQYYLAQLYLIDANVVRDQLKSLGMSAADKKKAADLDKVLAEKFRIAAPYWEKAEQLNPKDTEVLERLKTIYYYLGDEAKEARVTKRLKELGHDDN
jgi:tetratricopeptide (TPR) repeat protein